MKRFVFAVIGLTIAVGSPAVAQDEGDLDVSWVHLGGNNAPAEIKALFKRKREFPADYIDLFIAAFRSFKGEWGDKPGEPKKSFFDKLAALWRNIHTLNCEGVIDDITKLGYDYVPGIKRFFDWGPRGNTCAIEFAKGLVCSIPQAIFSLRTLVEKVVKAGWKSGCAMPLTLAKNTFLVGLLPPNPLAGYLVCSVKAYFKDAVSSFSACWKRISRYDKFALIVNTLGKKACNMLGEFVFDVVLGILTEGASIPGTLEAKVTRLAKLVDDFNGVVGQMDPGSWISKMVEGLGGPGKAVSVVRDMQKEFRKCGGEKFGGN